MQAIILCAGRGTRMKELTNDLPKPLLTYKDKNLLIHKLDNLPEKIKEVIIVIGYLGDEIKSAIGESYIGSKNVLKITYVEQKNLDGTCGAVHCAKDLVTGDFIVLMGDDLYDKDDLEKLVSDSPSTMMMGLDGVYTGGCLLLKDFFDLEKIKVDGNGNEYGIPQTLFFHQEKYPINFITAQNWTRITAPEDLK